MTFTHAHTHTSPFVGPACYKVILIPFHSSPPNHTLKNGPTQPQQQVTKPFYNAVFESSPSLHIRDIVKYNQIWTSIEKDDTLTVIQDLSIHNSALEYPDGHLDRRYT